MEKQNTILLVEDEKLTAHMLRKQLSEKNYKVLHLSTGEEAVEYILNKKSPINLILMDIDLGHGIYGTDAAIHILEQTDIPIVFLSNHTSPDIVEKAGKISSYGYIIKHSGIAVIDASVKMALRLFEAKKEAELHKNKLEASEEKYRKLTENTDTILWEFDIKADKWTHVSPQVERILGYKPSEWTNLKFWTNKLHPEERDWAANYCAECTKNGEDHSFEYRFKNKNGDYIWLLDEVKVEMKNGEPFKMWGSMINITERKKAELALKENELLLKKQNEEFHALNEEYSAINEELSQANQKLAHSRNLMQYIIEHNRSAVAVHDKEFKYIYVSQRYLDVYKVKDKNIIGKHHYEVFPDLPQKWRDVHQKALKGIISSKENDPYPKEDGTVEWTRWECRPWYESDGSIGGFIVYTEVITDRLKTELALQESEERLNLALDVKNEGVWDWDLITNETYFDDRYYTMAGYKPNEFPHNFAAWAYHVHPEDLPKTQKAIIDYLSGESSIFDCEFRFKKKDGTWIWINGKGKVVKRDPNNKPLRMVGTHTDITERKKAELALKENELKLKKQNEEYHALNEEYLAINEELSQANQRLAHSRNLMQYIIEHNRSAVAVHDKEFKYIYVSQRYLDDYNVKDDNIIGKHHYEIFPDLPQKFRDAHKKALKGIVSGKENDPYYKEDGTVEWTRWECRPWYESNGSIGGFIVYTEFITDQINTEKALRKSEHKHRTLLENAFDGVYLLHGKGFEYVNNQFCKLTGYSYKKLMDDNFDFKILLTEKSKKIIKQRDEYRKKGIRLDNIYEYQIKTKTGEIKDVEASTTTLKYEDSPLILGIIRDITRHKKAKKLESEILVTKQSAEFKQKFLANMSHELRTPLAGMLGFVDLLADTKLRPEQKLYIDTLRQSGENLKEIINLILDYSKIESGKVTLKQSSFSIKSIFENVKGLFFSICHKDIELKTKICSSLPDYISTDRQRLFQILSNLLSNGVKFTDHGKITITAKLLKPEKIDKPYPTGKTITILIEVKDTGHGIEKEAQNHLFKPFHQIDNGEVRTIEGTGLGLSICKELSKMLGGKIGVKSQPGKGSTFWFTFKALIAEKPIADIIETKKQKEQSKTTSLKVLLVDDKKVNQMAVGLMLKSQGHHVVTADNGKEAIEKFQTDSFDIILMDIQMPVMDGITATKKLKKEHKNVPPVVGLSANAMEGDREKFMKKGMDEYLIKPIKKEDFEKVVNKLIAG